MIDYNSLNLNEVAKEFIRVNKFEKLTPIQGKVIPLALKRKNIIGISKTGTGKTHAFLIPILNNIDVKLNALQVVITAPTRELAIQLYNRAKLMNKVYPELRIVEAVGGTDRKKAKVDPQILIGTPGRIKDLVEQNIYRVDKVRTFIVDEVDMTLEYGFLDEVDFVAGQMPNSLQMMVFGATVPNALKPFLKKYLTSANTINCEDSEYGPKIDHILVPCKHRTYIDQLVQIMPGFNPFVCLIFANTRKEASECSDELKNNGYSVIEIHGDLQPRQRKQALKQLNNSSHTYIVATDLAARGLDVDTVTHVVSLGFPTELDFYLHRAGRTGRAGKEGVCFALFQESDQKSINALKTRGVKFISKTYRNGVWREIKLTKREKPDDIFEKEIAKIVAKKNQKVKPGYKKKRQNEIEKIKRKKKRDMIQQSINQLKKEKNKAKQRAKNSEVE